ncbi:MAG: RHS repeat-associated core domain-containing protein, partial [Acidobacteriota bacterium]|nr:RHS repeat-associated core domain-containing protein [Acidobacteriota bacterium]
MLFVFNISGALTDRLLVVPPSAGQPASQVLADENASGAVSWLLPDNQGTIRDVAQYNSGTGVTSIVDHLKYDSFGNITAQSNSAYQPLFAYTGMQWDSAAGLYYDHARWYDPHLGRFISQDPTSFAAGDVNLYRYVGNGPGNGVDPTGESVTASTPGASPGASAMWGGNGMLAYPNPGNFYTEFGLVVAMQIYNVQHVSAALSAIYGT